MVLMGWVALAVTSRLTSPLALRAVPWLLHALLLLSYAAAWLVAIQRSRHPRLVSFHGATLTLAAAVGLGLLELPAAWGLIDWEKCFAQAADEGTTADYVFDPDTGFRRTPNLRWTGRPRSDLESGWNLPRSLRVPLTFTYDGGGYRNARERDRADVALIGDSYVEGLYVSDEQTVARRLEELLDRSVVNLGVAGYGTLQELIVLRRDALPLRPQVIVWFFFEGNDLYNDHAFENMMLALQEGHADPSAPTRSRGWKSSLVRQADRSLRRALDPIVAARCPHSAVMASGPHQGATVLFADYAAAPWTAWELERWRRTGQTLLEGARLTQAAGSRLLLVYVPIKFRVYEGMVRFPASSDLSRWALWPLPRLFSEFCAANAIACLDLTEPLRAAVRTGQMPYAATDTHWSPEGHALAAAQLRAALAQLGWP
jgi:hypothetical protein